MTKSENEDTIFALIGASTLGTMMVQNKQLLNEYSMYCAPEMKEELDKTTEQINIFLKILSEKTSAKYDAFMEKIK